MFMGVVNAPEIDMYFCIDGNLWGGLFMLNCAAYMSRHRFYDILTNFHFTDNEADEQQLPDKDRIGKFRKVLDLFAAL